MCGIRIEDKYTHKSTHEHARSIMQPRHGIPETRKSFRDRPYSVSGWPASLAHGPAAPLASGNAHPSPRCAPLWARGGSSARKHGCTGGPRAVGEWGSSGAPRGARTLTEFRCSVPRVSRNSEGSPVLTRRRCRCRRLRHGLAGGVSSERRERGAGPRASGGPGSPPNVP
jgi:hypothetical protein